MTAEEKLEQVSCNLCGNKESRYILTREDGLKVVECLECGLAFINPRPRKEMVLSLYDERYYKGKDEHKGYSNYAQETLSSLQRKDHYGYRIVPMISECEEIKGKRLLDIGCALGAFLVVARTFGLEVEGLELSDYAARFGGEKFGLKIKTGTLEEAGYPDNSFDFVTMFDLIEHLSDPMAFLKEVSRITKKDGVIVVMTPNYFCRKKYGEKWLGFTQSFEHLYFFDKSSLKRILGKAGFRPIMSQTLESSSSLQKTIFQKDCRKKTFLSVRELGMKLPALFYVPRFFWRAINLWFKKRNEKKGLGHNLFIIAQNKKAQKEKV